MRYPSNRRHGDLCYWQWPFAESGAERMSVCSTELAVPTADSGRYVRADSKPVSEGHGSQAVVIGNPHLQPCLS
jgi:hypothetical protein